MTWHTCPRITRSSALLRARARLDLDLNCDGWLELALPLRVLDVHVAIDAVAAAAAAAVASAGRCELCKDLVACLRVGVLQLARSYRTRMRLLYVSELLCTVCVGIRVEG